MLQCSGSCRMPSWKRYIPSVVEAIRLIALLEKGWLFKKRPNTPKLNEKMSTVLGGQKYAHSVMPTFAKKMGC